MEARHEVAAAAETITAAIGRRDLPLHARVRLDGQLIDDRRGFIDWFVEDAGTWRIQAAVDLPGSNPD